MSKTIRIHYTVSTYCIKDIEVPDDFKIKGKNAKTVYEELRERLPDEPLNSIENGWEEPEIDGDQYVFEKFDGVEVFDDTKGVRESYTDKKETMKYKVF